MPTRAFCLPAHARHALAACLLIACGGHTVSGNPDAASPTEAGAMDAAHPPGDSSADTAARDSAPSLDAPGNACDAPSAVVYDCTPVVLDGSMVAMGCVGGPSQAGSPDPQDIFPIGCVAHLAMCVPSFPNEVETCTCGMFPNPMGPSLDWTCPI